MMVKNYITRPKEKLVIAVMNRITGCDGVMREVEKKCSKNTFALIYNLITGDVEVNKNLDVFMCDDENFYGVAKCDDRDNFDAKKGMDIAGCKVDMKYHKAMVKKYNMIIKILQHAIDEVIRVQDAHIRKYVNIEHDLEKYYCDK